MAKKKKKKKKNPGQPKSEAAREKHPFLVYTQGLLPDRTKTINKRLKFIFGEED